MWAPIAIAGDTVGIDECAGPAELRRTAAHFRAAVESGGDLRPLAEFVHALHLGVQRFLRSPAGAHLRAGSRAHSLGRAWPRLQGVAIELCRTAGALDVDERLGRLGLETFTNGFVHAELLRFFEK